MFIENIVKNCTRITNGWYVSIIGLDDKVLQNLMISIDQIEKLWEPSFPSTTKKLSESDCLPSQKTHERNFFVNWHPQGLASTMALFKFSGFFTTENGLAKFRTLYAQILNEMWRCFMLLILALACFRSMFLKMFNVASVSDRGAVMKNNFHFKNLQKWLNFFPDMTLSRNIVKQEVST